MTLSSQSFPSHAASVRRTSIQVSERTAQPGKGTSRRVEYKVINRVHASQLKHFDMEAFSVFNYFKIFTQEKKKEDIPLIFNRFSLYRKIHSGSC